MDQVLFELRIGAAAPVKVLRLGALRAELEVASTRVASGGQGGRRAVPGPSRACPVQLTLDGSAWEGIWSWWAEVEEGGPQAFRPVVLSVRPASGDAPLTVRLEDTLLTAVSVDVFSASGGVAEVLVDLLPRRMTIARGQGG